MLSCVANRRCLVEQSGRPPRCRTLAITDGWGQVAWERLQEWRLGSHPARRWCSAGWWAAVTLHAALRWESGRPVASPFKTALTLPRAETLLFFFPPHRAATMLNSKI